MWAALTCTRDGRNRPLRFPPEVDGVTMKCAKCGMELPANVRQCPKCGLVNEFEQASEQAPRKRSPLVYVIAGLAALAVVALVVAVIAGRGRHSVVSAPGPVPGPPGNITTAPPGQPAGGGIMTAPPGVPAPPGATPPAAVKPKPPKEVVEYLEFVKGVEKHRQMLLKDTTDALVLTSSVGVAQGLLDLIDMAMDPDGAEARDPLAETRNELNRQYRNWLSILEYFDKKPAPPQCREFSGAYRAVLYLETKAIGEIASGMKNVNLMDPKDMGRLLKNLQAMKADPTIQGNIDKACDDADAKLTALVGQYDMEKPFDVPRERKTSPGIMGF